MFKLGYKYNILSIMSKNYSINDFHNLSSSMKKSQLTAPIGYLSNSNPQTTPNSQAYYKMEIDMNHPNDLKYTGLNKESGLPQNNFQSTQPQQQSFMHQPQNIQGQTQQVAYTPNTHQSQQQQQPPPQQVVYQQPPQIIYQQPPPQQVVYQQPPQIVYKDREPQYAEPKDYIEFTTKKGDKVRFKSKKQKKPKVKQQEEVIIKNEQTKVETIPQQHN